MTNKEKFEAIKQITVQDIIDWRNISVENHINEIDWLTAHHLDYRGPIFLWVWLCLHPKECINFFVKIC